jgi:heme/copper-type cytochrome/quinol oxidase subunit 3
MTAIPALDVTHPPEVTSEKPSGRTVGWWGMVMFITTEATLFAVLLGSYFYVRFQFGGEWPPFGIEKPKLMRPLIMTALLLPSSLPVMWAERGIRKGQRWRLRMGLAATICMGAGFLILQAMEYREKLDKYTLASNVYGSFFYTITGFHGLHVFIGLIMVTWLLSASIRGSFGARHHQRVVLAALYWHFVDLVWAAILFTIYLSGQL